jgi:hypothetical protein
LAICAKSCRVRSFNVAAVIKRQYLQWWAILRESSRGGDLCDSETAAAPKNNQQPRRLFSVYSNRAGKANDYTAVWGTSEEKKNATFFRGKTRHFWFALKHFKPLPLLLENPLAKQDEYGCKHAHRFNPRMSYLGNPKLGASDLDSSIGYL